MSDYDDLFYEYMKRSDKLKNSSSSNTDTAPVSADQKASTVISSYDKSFGTKKTKPSTKKAKGIVKENSNVSKLFSFNKRSDNKAARKKNYYSDTVKNLKLDENSENSITKTKKPEYVKGSVSFNSAQRQYLRSDSTPIEHTYYESDEKPSDFTSISKDEYRKKYEHSSNRYSLKDIHHSKKTKTADTVQTGFFDRFRRPLIFFTVVIVASAILSAWGISCVNDVLAINRDGDKTITVTIDKKVDTNDVLDILKDKKLIKNKLFCKIFCKFRNFSDDYETGVFYLTDNMGVESMLMALKNTATTEEAVKITFPEGYTVMEMATKLEANDVCSVKNFVDTLENFDFTEFDFITDDLMNDSKRLCYLEGYLFPSTYEFYVGESPSSVIKKMLKDGFQAHISSEDKLKAKALGLSLDEVVILASIVQKEAGNSKQMADIASVLLNRLNDSATFPNLDCDSTTDFLNGELAEYLKIVPNKGTVDYFSLYYNTNSSACTGLPAGAICNPGYDAIYAVLNPNKTDYYFFCHDKDGEIYLASTLSEHERNLATAGLS